MNDSDLHRGAELRRLLLTSKDTMLQAHDALANLKSITSDRGGARADLGSSLRDLAAVTASLRGFAADIERHPELLLTGRKWIAC
jgi:paraquat-inducible protein B